MKMNMRINQQALALASYCMSSILMTVANKLVLSTYKFYCNFLLLGIQSGITVLLLVSFSQMGVLFHKPLNSRTAKTWFPVSLALVAMIYTGSKALQYLSIPLVTIFKNLTIILIAYSERKFFNGPPVSSLMLTSFGMMVSSSFLAGYADIMSGSVLKDGSSVFTAYFWMFSNCISTAYYAVSMKSVIASVGFKDFDTVYYNNLPVLFALSLLTESSEYFTFYSDYLDPLDDRYLWGLGMGILLSSVSAFAISFSTSWSVRVSTSTTYSMVGALNKLPVAIFGMFFFSDPVTFTGVMSIFIAFGAGIIYSIAKAQNSSSASLPRYSNVAKTEVLFEDINDEE